MNFRNTLTGSLFQHSRRELNKLLSNNYGRNIYIFSPKISASAIWKLHRVVDLNLIDSSAQLQDIKLFKTHLRSIDISSHEALITHHSVLVLFLVERIFQATARLPHHSQGGFVQLSTSRQFIHPLEDPGSKNKWTNKQSNSGQRETWRMVVKLYTCTGYNGFTTTSAFNILHLWRVCNLFTMLVSASAKRCNMPAFTLDWGF